MLPENKAQDDFLSRLRTALPEPQRARLDALLHDAVTGHTEPEALAAAYERLRPDRHGQGVYYTPRDEVRFMCREALRACLAAACGCAEDAPFLLKLIYDPDPWKGEAGQAAALFRLVAGLRVCDPAAGSGALLAGMAEEMTRLLERLGRALPSGMLPNTGGLDPSDPAALRRHVITRCLYGVDLDAAALQIARWRLFSFGGVDESLPAALRAHLRQGDGLQLPDSADASFQWQHDFQDVFSGPRPGFDIVIANPPYVRQELLTPDYKRRAALACQALLPVETPLSGKSDLYVYFYHLGLGLLREGGALCIISSNSWLDVSFGEPLRALLLRHSRILSLVESDAAAAFAGAKINPVIGLFRRAASGDPDGMVRFIRLRRRLEADVEAAAHFSGAEEFLSLPAYRVMPVAQSMLASREQQRSHWGGAYLRAPDLFLRLREECGDRLCRLETLARTRFGIKTGANEFFYLERLDDAAANGESVRCHNGAGYECRIEARYLRPVLRSPREVQTPVARREDARSVLFWRQDARELPDATEAGRYIEWGEQEMGLHRRASMRTRPRWYAVPPLSPAPILYPLISYERACAALNPDGLYNDANLVGITPIRAGDTVPLLACLISSLGVLLRELIGIANLGQGALKTNPAYLARLLVPDLRLVAPDALARVEAAFDAVRSLPFPSLLDGEPAAAWLALDDAVLALLGDGAPDAAAVRAAARDVLRLRLEKAGALSRRKRAAVTE